MLARCGDCQLAESDLMVKHGRQRGRGGTQMGRIAPDPQGEGRGLPAYLPF